MTIKDQDFDASDREISIGTCAMPSSKYTVGVNNRQGCPAFKDRSGNEAAKWTRGVVSHDESAGHMEVWGDFWSREEEPEEVKMLAY